MDLNVEVQLAGLAVVLGDGAVLVAGDDVLVEVAPSGNGSFALVANNGHDLLVALLCLHINLDVEDNDGAQMSHALLRYAQQLGTIGVELDTLDGCWELPGLEVLAGLDVPETDGIIGRTRSEKGGRGVNVDGPDGAYVTVVGSEALAIVSEPYADLLILGDGENEIAIAVVSISLFWLSAPHFKLYMYVIRCSSYSVVGWLARSR